MEPGASGGDRERGEGRDAPGFDPGGRFDFGEYDVPGLVDYERELAREANRIADLVAERLGERPGRFGMTSSVFGRERTALDRVRDFALSALKNIVGHIPGIGAPAATAMDLIE